MLLTVLIKVWLGQLRSQAELVPEVMKWMDRIRWHSEFLTSIAITLSAKDEDFHEHPAYHQHITDLMWLLDNRELRYRLKLIFASEEVLELYDRYVQVGRRISEIMPMTDKRVWANEHRNQVMAALLKLKDEVQPRMGDLLLKKASIAMRLVRVKAILSNPPTAKT